MDFAFKISEVTAVLLADGWHEVMDSSLCFDRREIDAGGNPTQVEGWPVREAWAEREDSGLGFTFEEYDRRSRVAGPLTSIIAVRLMPR